MRMKLKAIAEASSLVFSDYFADRCTIVTEAEYPEYGGGMTTRVRKPGVSESENAPKFQTQTF